jgi:hypothetical protein
LPKKKKHPKRRKPKYSKASKRIRRIRNLVQLMILDFKRKGCAICAEPEICCLTAHHRLGVEKKFNIGSAKKQRIHPDKVAAELDKCICLCLNCHAKIHAGILEEPPDEEKSFGEETEE